MQKRFNWVNKAAKAQRTDAKMWDDSLREGWIPVESGMTPFRRDEFLRELDENLAVSG